MLSLKNIYLLWYPSKAICQAKKKKKKKKKKEKKRKEGNVTYRYVSIESY